MAFKSGVSSRSWPEAIYVYVKFGYDRTLKNQLENSDGTDFATWTDAIMTHVQGHYRHPTLPTKIEFKVLSQSFKLHIIIFLQNSLPSSIDPVSCASIESPSRLD